MVVENEYKIMRENFALNPNFQTTMTRQQLSKLLLDSGGNLFCRGYLRDIKSKHLGAGVYKVWTELDESP